MNDSLTCGDIDECADFGCSQECENFVGSFLCKCDTGYELDTDGHTCKVTNKDRILMISAGTQILKNDIDSNSLSTITYANNIIAMDFDWQTQRVYYADSLIGWMHSVFANGTDKKTLIRQGLQTVENIAVDWVGRHLYWCDSGSNTIEVSKLNGSHRSVLFSEDLDQPRGLVLDPRD